MSNFRNPEHGFLCIYIVDIISKSALVLFTILSASRNHFQKHPIIFDHIKCKTIHRGLLVILILQSNFIWLLIDINFMITFLWWGENIDIMWHCPLNYDDNFMSIMFIIKCHASLLFSWFPIQWFPGIFFHNCSKQFTNHITFDFQFQSTTTFEVTRFPLH